MYVCRVEFLPGTFWRETMNNYFEDKEFKIEEVDAALCEVVDSVFTKKEIESHKDYFGDMKIYDIKDNFIMDYSDTIFEIAKKNGYRGKSLKRLIKHGCKTIIDLEKWLSSVCENGGDEQ